MVRYVIHIYQIRLRHKTTRNSPALLYCDYRRMFKSGRSGETIHPAEYGRKFFFTVCYPNGLLQTWGIYDRQTNQYTEPKNILGGVDLHSKMVGIKDIPKLIRQHVTHLNKDWTLYNKEIDQL